MVEFVKPNYTYRATVDRVVDGDTVDVYIDVGFKITIFKRLRLLDLDTEEIRDKDPERRVKAQAAKQRMIELLQGDTIYVQTEWDSTGKYGRLLAWIWVEEDGIVSNKNVQMVEEGYQKTPKMKVS